MPALLFESMFGLTFLMGIVGTLFWLWALIDHA